MDPHTVAKDFVEHFYKTFDTDRSKLLPLYRDESRMTFEGIEFVGTQAIIQKYTSLGFKTSQHKLSSCDCQLSPSGGLLVFVTGQLLPDGETYPQRFSQAFHLVKAGEALVLSNDMFRLNTS